MSKIVFKNHEAYAVSGKGEEVKIDSLSGFLTAEIEISKGTLFDDLWKYIEVDYSLYNLIFMETLGYFDLQIYIDQYKKPSAPREDEDPNDSMKSLELSWVVDLHEYKDGTKSFEVGPDFHGKGMSTNGDFNGEGKTEPESCTYGLSFTPVNDLKGYEISLDPYTTISKYSALGKNVAEKFSVVGKGYEKKWTVFDVLVGIFGEISWSGSPNDQMKMLSDLEQTIAEVKDGTMTTKPIDLLDLFKDQTEIYDDEEDEIEEESDPASEGEPEDRG